MLTGVLSWAAAIGGIGNAMNATKIAAMNKLVIQILTAMTLTIAALLAFAKGVSAGDISVVEATASYVKGAPTAAVNFIVKNSGADDALIGISSDVSGEAMLHETKNENDVMKMRMVDELELKSGATVDLRKAGLHVMLVGLKEPLVPGDALTLRLTFKKSEAVEVEALVQ